jgi:SAM-dependent methyltransferase
MKPAFRFDARYYQRYYEDPKTRVSGDDEAAQLAQFLGAYLRYLGQPVRNILDLGCGAAQMRAPLLAEFPGASYLGVERSEYACKRYGLRRGSAVDFRARGRFDLIVCKGVLQYLTRDEAEAALENLARLARGSLYLEALTREDWQHVADQGRTDGEVYLRAASFYRRQLRANFRAAGGGLFIHERSPVLLYALEGT